MWENYFYRPHPKDGGKYCFQFVCQSTSWGGEDSSQVWPGGVTPSQVWTGVPPQDLGWIPPPDLEQGTPWTWDQVPPGPGTRYPLDLGLGTPCPQTCDRVPPVPGTRHPPRPGTGYPPPDLGPGTPTGPGTGYPPPDLGPGTPPQNSEEHSIRGGRYACYVHTGGLSCSR